MLMRLIDYLKSRQITCIFTSLTESADDVGQSEVGVSSLIDTWLLLRFLESSGERNRALYILKSRGMAHSNQVREFVMSEHGVDLVDVYLGPQGGVVTGSARYVQEAAERAARVARQQEMEMRQRELQRQRAAMERAISALQAEYEAREDDFERLRAQEQGWDEAWELDRRAMARLRYQEPEAVALQGLKDSN
jgi:circadian clock protein KaiC